MTRKSFAIFLKAGAVAFLLVVFLVAYDACGSSRGFIGSAIREIAAVLRDPETQWMIFLCLGIYFSTFLFLRARVAAFFWQTVNPILWLASMLLISAMIYAFNYPSSVDALMLLGGAVMGQGVAAWAGLEVRSQKSEVRNRFLVLVTSVLVILLALASIWNVNSSHIFEYHGHTRWSGPWDNPNIFGLFMGVGAALAAGMAVRRWRMEDGERIVSGVWRLASGKYLAIILCLISVGLMARGLLHSYSRGAWLATGCGVTYLFWHWINHEIHQTHESNSLRSSRCEEAQFSKTEGRKQKTGIPCVSWLKCNWFPLSVVLLSVVVLSFWHFRQTEWHPARRALSAVNTVDFSWRNRIAAWQGALQMMAEHPWFGAGWNQPEPLYEHFYRAPKVVEGLAIRSNDYLMLGATLGIPALFCFGMYVWLSLTRNAECGVRSAEEGDQNLETGWKRCPTLELDWLPATCRAGAIVLLVGFWFDGGLFKLPTAATFWILLELGSAGNREIHQTHGND